MLSPILFTIFKRDYVSVDQSVLVINFPDDTTVDGCFINGDETAYREEVQRIVGRCTDDNLQLNVLNLILCRCADLLLFIYLLERQTYNF